MLENQKIIITGAASGIGKGIVEACLQAGASVIACDLDRQGLQSLQEDANLFVFPLDVSKYEDVTAFFSYVETNHPDLTGLVNNAGIYLGKHIFEYDLDSISKVLEVNIKGYIYFTQFFGKLMFSKQRYGTIINISSVSGQEGSSDAVYGCSKAAILGLTKSCAMNFSPYIRVNAVAPTMVATPMMDSIPEWRKKEYLAQELIDNPVLPEDVADTVVFLLSEKGKHYTGATFDLNNGAYLR